MKKNIISILTLASFLTLSSCGNDVPINSETSSNNQTNVSSNIGNSSYTPSDDPVLPDIDSDKFDVIFDNNTTTLDKITVIDKENANKGVSLTINGVKSSVGTLSSDGKLELTWTQAPLDKSTITFSIDGTDNSKTINKLSPTMMNALQRSYGFQNAFASTYDELVLQVIYCAENGNRYMNGKSVLLGDKGMNIYEMMSSYQEYAHIAYSPEIINTSILNTLPVTGDSVQDKFINALMKDTNVGTGYSNITSVNTSSYDSNTYVIGLKDGLIENKDTDCSPSTTKSNKPSFAGFKPYYGNGVSSLPIDSYPTVNHINTGFAVYYYTSLGYRPICESNSSAYKVYNNARNVLLNILDDSMSEYQKVLAIHDWITFRATYNTVDINNGYNQFIDGLLKEEDYNLTVCNGYALTFSTLCAMAGIEAKYVTGYAREGHAWNEVKVDGKWYCVDTTWDKATSTNYQFENHKYFLVSWQTLSNWTEGGRTKDLKYSYSTSSKAINGDYPYYQSQNYTYNNLNYSRYISSDVEVTRAISYINDKYTKIKNGTLKQESCKATLRGYTTIENNHSLEEFSFSNSDLFNSFKSKLFNVSYSKSTIYQSFSVYINA